MRGATHVTLRPVTDVHLPAAKTSAMVTTLAAEPLATSPDIERLLATLVPSLTDGTIVLDALRSSDAAALAAMDDAEIRRAFGADPGSPMPVADAARRIDAWAAALGLANVRSAIALDVTTEVWPVEAADALLCSNMIHIAPWAAAVGLMRGAGRVLPPGGRLAIEVGHDQALAVRDIVARAGRLVVIDVVADIESRPRVVLASRR